MLTYRRCCLLVLLTTCTVPTESRNRPRIITFGDSNTDAGYVGATIVAHSYVDPEAPARAFEANNPYTLAGMLDARGIPAVNHGISGTQSGRGRIASGAPNALEVVGGVTRFEAEVLGLGYPWDGGGPLPISRLEAFQPTACDYVYVSFGTNDGYPRRTIRNLRAMILQWIASGRSPRHFIVTTLAPTTIGTWHSKAIPTVNPRIRWLAAETRVMVVDLARFTSNDDGWNWRDSTLHVDGVHYTEVVRTWIADRVSEYVRKQGCN